MKFEFINSLIQEGKKPDGTFVGVKISKESKDALISASKKMKVPNIIDKDKIHITLIYSRKHLPKFEAKGKLEKPIIVSVDKLDIFPAQEGDSKALIVKLDAPDLVKRHKEIMKEEGATYDFPKYIPHITLSYDVGDFDAKAEKITDYMSNSNLEIVEEYAQDLELNWAKKN